jgi:hypothetical protein
MPVNRRRFLKYAGATAAVGVAAFGLNYLATHPPIPGQRTLTTLNHTTTTSSIAILPRITSFTYKPSKVVNSKIYDIQVDVEVSDPARQLSSVQVALQPVAYAHLPGEAFPNEQSQVNILQPTGLEKELLSTKFMNLKGGREYDVKTSAYAPDGIIETRTLRTEYVREFENIAALDDITVIADYYTWYGLPSEPGNHWRYYEDEINGPSQHLYSPLLGEYASGDQIVISKHIDWATGHGIDAFSISWHTTGSDERTWDYHCTENLEAFLRNPLLNDMRFCILYEDHDRFPVKTITYDYDPVHGTELMPVDRAENKARLLEDFTFMANRYFSHPQYLRINGGCFVQFDGDRIWSGDIRAVLDAVRKQVRASGHELYLCSNILGWYFPNAPHDALEPRNRQIVQAMDAISASGNMWLYGYEEARKDFAGFTKGLYDRWLQYGQGHNPTVELLPNIMPGQEIHPSLVSDPAYVPLKRSLELWNKLISLARRYGKIWKLTAFDEWISGLGVEPSKEEGFAYLEALRDSI